MKITKKELMQIIKEEIGSMAVEMSPKKDLKEAKLIDKIMVCDNCIQVIANDDWSALSDEEEKEVSRGIERFRKAGEWLALGDSENEDDFSPYRCGCCHSKLAGRRHEVGVLGGNDPIQETKEDDEEAEENAMRYVPGEEKRKAEKAERDRMSPQERDAEKSAMRHASAKDEKDAEENAYRFIPKNKKK